MTSPSIERPALTRHDVDACRPSAWHQQFRGISIKTTIVPLPAAFIAWLKSDGLRVPLGSDTLAEEATSEGDESGEEASDASDEDEPPAFPELDAIIRQTIQKYDGAVFPKLNWSSPQDAAWINAGRHLECKSPADVYLLLKASDFISHDLEHAYDECVDGTEPAQTYELVLKKWFDMPRSQEFRCFVKHKRIVAISQRDDNFYDFLQPLDTQCGIIKKAEDLHQRHIAPKFDCDNYTFDIYFTRDWQRLFLIDFNPFAMHTDSLLFDWEEIYSMSTQEQPQLRLVESQLHASQALPKFSHNRYPADVVQLSQGKDAATFAKQFNDNLAEAVAETLDRTHLAGRRPEPER